jgi:FixJ family two-component response regulator
VKLDEYIVLIVDDDARLREALQELMAAVGLHAVVFESAAAYLAYPKPDVPACLVLDVNLPGMNGLELQRHIAQDYHPPIIFLTGQGDVPSSVRAIKAGALDFLTKPFHDQELLGLIHAALSQDFDRRASLAEFNDLQRRFQSLTKREREVMGLVVKGLLNKQAAAQLGISENTLQIHRTHVMHKMEAGSFADLVRMAGRLEAGYQR